MYKLSRADKNGQPIGNEQERMENNTIGFKETNAGELTPQQEAAVAMVLDGKSDTEISRELKMRRQTVNEWRNHNIEFMLELKMRRDQVWEKQREKLGEAVEKALDVLIGYLEHDDEEIRLKTASLGLFHLLFDGKKPLRTHGLLR